MAEATSTRKQLRRAIASELQMPFFRRYAAEEGVIDNGSTATKIIDAALTQAANAWNGHWFYGLLGEDVSLIRAFDSATDSFQLEVPMASAPATGDKYEIHTIWNALDIHKAINRALETVARTFPEVVDDLTMVFCEDKMTYDISGLAKKPFMILSLFAERPTTIIRGAVASGGASSVTIADSATALSGVASTWLVSIYAGTGQNQVRIVSSVSGQTINTTLPWTTQPDSTSKYAVWNPSKQRYDWQRVDIFYNDSVEYPDELRMRTRIPYYYGMRMRLTYLSINTALTSDTSTTVVPKEYLIPAACAILHSQMLGNTKVDRDLHYSEYKRYDEIANRYLLMNAPRTPGITIQSSESPTYMDVDDPLGWYMGRNQ